MKSEKNILIAFLLNLLFSAFEFAGGIITGSTAILSDAVHDLGDCASLGLSWYLERKSKQEADEKYTYGYNRYSLLGGAITSLILLLGCAVVITNGIRRLFYPVAINYNGMIIFAIVGVIVNTCAVFCTRGGSSMNQKAVNLHMMEDVLGWIVVLAGAIIMRFTDLPRIDPILSIGVSLFILLKTIPNLKLIAELFLEKTPENISIQELQEQVSRIDGIVNVHHLHVHSLDGEIHCATMHVVARGESHRIKTDIRRLLTEYGIEHVTLELEQIDEPCPDEHCFLPRETVSLHRHHHHHH